MEQDTFLSHVLGQLKALKIRSNLGKQMGYLRMRQEETGKCMASQDEKRHVNTYVISI